MSISGAAIHSALAGSWPSVLEQLGIAPEFLRNVHGPCPACGGTDRYRFDDRDGRGTWICNQCGAGDGFALLQRVHGWTFSEARRQVIDAARLEAAVAPAVRPRATPKPLPLAKPTARARRLLSGSVSPDAVPDVCAYLESRALWPLPAGCALRAHRSVEYWHERRCVGSYPALLAEVRDVAGELVTVHVTYLHAGRKLETHAPRKILSRMTGRRGCAVRLMPMRGAVLGIAEGIETALAAYAWQDIPVWAALNAPLLAKFEPPAGVHRLLIFADNDEPGLEAAEKLRRRLHGRVALETKVPGRSDWAAQLTEELKCS